MRTFYRQIPSIAVFVILLLLASCPATGEKSGTSSSSGKSGTPGGTCTRNAVDFSYT
ncbi:hypothetical protein IIA79_07310, partial [bacterium]|nr:hypothetical protein [bacterium]